MAPQSPDVAPGPSSASFDPHTSGSSRHDDLRDDKFASPRGGLDKGEHVPVGIRHVSPPTSPSHQDRLWEELESVHTQISHTGKSTTSVSPVVGHLQIYLRMIWRFFSPSMLSLA